MPSFRILFYELIIAALVIRELLQKPIQCACTSNHSSSSLNDPTEPVAETSSTVNSTVTLPSSESLLPTFVNDSARFTVDIVSIGSHTRVHYLEAQQRSFASHTSVRQFFPILEDDDDEPQCGSTVDWYNVSAYCYNHREAPYLLRKMQEFYQSPKKLQTKENPAGWLCAQKRPVYGLLKAIRSYQHNQKFPSYLVIMDDDSYYNMELFEAYFSSKDPDIPMTYGGELSMLRITRKPPVKQRFFFAYGGFGLILSRKVLQNLLQPIYCNGNEANRNQTACQRLQENVLGERVVFSEGMSVLDLMEAYVNYQKFTDWKQWTIGYCLHSDWTLAYFITYYEVSLHATDTIYYDNYRHARLQKVDYAQEQKLHPVCQKEETCCNQSGMCHYQDPADMRRWTEFVKSQAPHKFRTP